MRLLTKDKHTSFSRHPSAHRSRWDHDVVPLGLHDETALTRRQSAQHHLLANSADPAFTGLPDARDPACPSALAVAPCELVTCPTNPLRGLRVSQRRAKLKSARRTLCRDPARPSALAVEPCEFVTCPTIFLRKDSIGIVTTCVVFRTRSATFCGFHLYRHTPTAPKQHAVMQGKGSFHTPFHPSLAELSLPEEEVDMELSDSAAFAVSFCAATRFRCFSARRRRFKFARRYSEGALTRAILAEGWLGT